MKRYLLMLLLLTLAVPACAADLRFSWLPNSDEVTSGYKINYGTASRVYDQSVDAGNPSPIDGVIIGEVKNIPYGIEYFFAASAYNPDGDESDYSNEVVVITPWPIPGVPSGFQKVVQLDINAESVHINVTK